MSQYLFRVKTPEGFIIKLLSEYLANTIKHPQFYVSQKGISLRTADQNREILIDLDLPRENFKTFKCPKPLNFTVNSAHLYRLLKTIKKKDSVTIFIDENRPMKLGIRVEQAEDTSDKVTTFINIVYVQPEEMDLPEGYGEPRIAASKQFQKLKALHGIGSDITVTVVGKKPIKFFVNGKDLFSREIPIGEEEDDDEESETSPADQPTYCQTFSTHLITQLTKCAGQSGNIQIFYDEELPLQIKMRIGTLGNMTVYIKSKELIEMLENDSGEEEQGEEGERATESLAFDDGGKSEAEEGEDDQDEEEEEAEIEAQETPKGKNKTKSPKKKSKSK